MILISEGTLEKYGKVSLEEFEKLLDLVGGVAGMKLLATGKVKIVPVTEAGTGNPSRFTGEEGTLPKKVLPICGHSSQGKTYVRPFTGEETAFVASFNIPDRLGKILHTLAASGNEPMRGSVYPSDRQILSKMLNAHPELPGRLAAHAGEFQLWRIA